MLAVLSVKAITRSGINGSKSTAFQKVICELPFASVSKRVLVRNYYTGSFSCIIYERFFTSIRFQTETQGISEIAYIAFFALRVTGLPWHLYND